MSLALIRLFLGNWLSRIWTFLSHRSFWQIACGAALILAGVQTIRLKMSVRHSHKVEAQLGKSEAARKADRQAYQDAQAKAAADNLAHNARDKAERERITHDISQSYQAQLASLRADLANRLRSAPQGAPGVPGLPGVSQAPSGPDDGSRVSIPASLYVHGAELELQLERLQQWVGEQLKVKTN